MANSIRHWANQQERGSSFALLLTRYLVKYCPVLLLSPIVCIVVAYFYLTASSARRNVACYQHLLAENHTELSRILSVKGSVFRQFYAFAQAIVDRFAVWQGRIRYEDLIIHDPDNLTQYIDQPVAGTTGQIFVCSHLGNTEICRALVKKHKSLILNVLIHSSHAVKFNQALKDAGASRIRLIQVTSLDTKVMMELNERVQRGEWLAIAADRVPVRGEKIVAIPFLGQTANWPQGPWLLAGLLKVPVNTLFCFKQQGKYHLHIQRFAANVIWKRQKREHCIKQYVQQYAQLLGTYCCKAPRQWFNFFDFWNQDDRAI
ncbi:glycosyl transferase family 2 [Snodgrassella alvi]|uniref:LpxL/LpxP family acyltransferase n=1 Tax=Snodgrassella alvi TaxID=1196083 RepID=UPI00352F79DD